jgi:hypothetical protein
MKKLVVGLVLLVAPFAHAADKIQASISGNAQKVVFTHGLGMIDSKGKVYVRLLGAEPNAKELTRAMQDDGGIFGVFNSPKSTVDLDFKTGTTRADLASFESCHVGFYEFEIGIFDWNAFSKGCGPIEFSGDLKVGGVLHGKLKGQGEGYHAEGQPARIYAWDVDFTVTLRAKP